MLWADHRVWDRFVVARILIAILATAIVGCTETLRFNVYPPGAQITAGGSCTSPCMLSLSHVPKVLPYRMSKPPLYLPSEGLLHARIAPGRVVGAIFTLGILAAARSMYYFPPAEAHLEPASAPANQLQLIREHGGGRVEGQAFTETRGGEVRHATGDTITIRPDTPYVRDALEFLAFKRRPAEGLVTSDPDLDFLDDFKRQTIGDADGRFTFDNLAPGKYIVSAVISWEAPGSEALLPQLVEVVGFADVREGETTKVIATDWTAQRYGIGRHGETVLPPVGSDVERIGQRREPSGKE